MPFTHLYKERYSDEYGKDKHAAEAVEMQSPPAGAVHQGNGDEGHDDHDDADADCRKLGALLRQARRREQVRRVVENLQGIQGVKSLASIKLYTDARVYQMQ